MAEIITSPATSVVKIHEVKELHLNWDGKLVRVVLLETLTGARPAFEFTGDVAVALMTTLNTANLSVVSLHRRILTYLTNQGLISGIVSGVPV